MDDPISIFITWTTYGTWMPGDLRGWRKRSEGVRLPRPLLAQWCKDQMMGEAILLEPHDRHIVELACEKHCLHRNWILHSVNARTNHVHVVVTANDVPQKVRDQLKANCTRELRNQTNPLVAKRTWSKGGDCEILNCDEDIEAAIIYTSEAQDNYVETERLNE